AAARAARFPCQLHDPREGADARPGALRGFRVLRSHDTGAARGFGATAVSGDAQLFAGAEPDLTGELCGTAVSFLAMGRGAAGGRRVAGVRRRDAFLESGLPAVPLAFYRTAPAGLPGNGDRARRPRQGSEALRAGTPLPRSLQGHSSRAVRAGA